MEMDIFAELAQIQPTLKFPEVFSSIVILLWDKIWRVLFLVFFFSGQSAEFIWIFINPFEFGPPLKRSGWHFTGLTDYEKHSFHTWILSIVNVVLSLSFFFFFFVVWNRFTFCVTGCNILLAVRMTINYFIGVSNSLIGGFSAYLVAPVFVSLLFEQPVVLQVSWICFYVLLIIATYIHDCFDYPNFDRTMEIFRGDYYRIQFSLFSALYMPPLMLLAGSFFISVIRKRERMYVGEISESVVKLELDSPQLKKLLKKKESRCLPMELLLKKILNRLTTIAEFAPECLKPSTYNNDFESEGSSSSSSGSSSDTASCPSVNNSQGSGSLTGSLSSPSSSVGSDKDNVAKGGLYLIEKEISTCVITRKVYKESKDAELESISLQEYNTLLKYVVFFSKEIGGMIYSVDGKRIEVSFNSLNRVVLHNSVACDFAWMIYKTVSEEKQKKNNSTQFSALRVCISVTTGVSTIGNVGCKGFKRFVQSSHTHSRMLKKMESAEKRFWGGDHLHSQQQRQQQRQNRILCNSFLVDGVVMQAVKFEFKGLLLKKVRLGDDDKRGIFLILSRKKMKQNVEWMYQLYGNGGGEIENKDMLLSPDLDLFNRFWDLVLENNRSCSEVLNDKSLTLPEDALLKRRLTFARSESKRMMNKFQY